MIPILLSSLPTPPTSPVPVRDDILTPREFEFLCRMSVVSLPVKRNVSPTPRPSSRKGQPAGAAAGPRGGAWRERSTGMFHALRNTHSEKLFCIVLIL